MQNWFATLALLAWPLVAAWLYTTRQVSTATLWTTLGAQLLLPVGAAIKFEMIPQFDKGSISAFCILAGCVVCARRPIRILDRLGLIEALMLMYLIGPLFSALLNGDQITYEALVLQGTGLYDGISAVEVAFITLIPFFVGRLLLSGETDNLQIMRVLVVAGLAYSFPLLFEIRFSPQLHNWFYGYAPSAFDQSARGDGYRPMVFLGHGLVASMFVMTTVIASVTLWRTRTTMQRLPAGGVTAYLSFVLVICKSLAPILYGAALGALVHWAKPRLQVRIAVVLTCVALCYPMLRAYDLFPTSVVAETADVFSSERSGSIQFRFDNEDVLLKKALERPVFGWGRFGRSRVYSDYGTDISTTDGRWVITMGQFGLFGFIAEFGLFALVIFRAAFALRFARSQNERILFAALSLILAGTLVDQLPNSSLLPWSWLLCGALLGRAESLRALASQKPVPPRFGVARGEPVRS